MANIDRAVDVQVSHVTERLVHDYAGRVEDTVVREMVTAAYQGYAPARVTQFLPVLIDREVRQRLAQAAGRSA